MNQLNKHEQHLLDVFKTLYCNEIGHVELLGDFKITVKKANEIIDILKELRFNFAGYVENINVIIYLIENTKLILDGYPEEITYKLNDNGNFESDFNLENYISQLIEKD